jgi:hypothetical protein
MPAPRAESARRRENPIAGEASSAGAAAPGHSTRGPWPRGEGDPGRPAIPLASTTGARYPRSQRLPSGRGASGRFRSALGPAPSCPRPLPPWWATARPALPRPFPVRSHRERYPAGVGPVPAASNQLKEIVEDSMEELFRVWDDRFRDTLGPLHPRVRAVLERFLRCGDPHFGFLRLWCPKCGENRLVPHSCRGRGLCPSCGQRRAIEWAERMVDEVLPVVP